MFLSTSDVSGDHSTPKQRRHLFMPSWCPVWTTATRYSLELQSVTNKLQRVLNAAARVVSGTRKYDRSLTTLIYTGLMFQIEWHTSSACWCTGVCKAQLRNTSSTHARLWRRRPATFTVCQSSAARRTTTPAHHTWPSGLRCYGSHGLELAARRPSSSTEQWLFLSAPKDFPFFSLLAYSAH